MDYLKRTPQMVNASREGEDMVEPAAGIYGPKVMIVNEMSGSGGDALPWLFRQRGPGAAGGHADVGRARRASAATRR